MKRRQPTKDSKAQEAGMARTSSTSLKSLDNILHPECDSLAETNTAATSTTNGSNVRDDAYFHSDSDEDGVPYRAAAMMSVSSPPSSTSSSSFCFGIRQAPAPCLQREVGRLSSQQKQKISQDLVGIPDTSVDVPDSAIHELHEEIHTMLSAKKGTLVGGISTEAYEIALEQDYEYTMSKRLGLAFLRCVSGSTKRAAKRYIRHFATKMELFGRDKLCKDIELSDLDEYDMEALESGGFQVLKDKDRAGRPILFGKYTCMKYRSVTNMIRALYYVWMSMVEDEEHQKSGIVAIGFENGKTPLERYDNSALMESAGAAYDLHAVSTDGGFDRGLARGILSLPLSLPIRPVGYHICADNNQWQGISDMVAVTLCKFVRLRLRFHYGTMQETKYQLMTHGVPVNAIPVTNDGEVDLTYHMQWIANRKHLEKSRSQ